MWSRKIPVAKHYLKNSSEMMQRFTCNCYNYFISNEKIKDISLQATSVFNTNLYTVLNNSPFSGFLMQLLKASIKMNKIIVCVFKNTVWLSYMLRSTAQVLLHFCFFKLKWQKFAGSTLIYFTFCVSPHLLSYEIILPFTISIFE